MTVNHWVAGSSPAWAATFLINKNMKENKLGRKFANTWSPPRNRFAARRANKGVRKNAKLMIKKYI